MTEGTGNKRSGEPEGQATKADADPNARFKPADSVADMPIQASGRARRLIAEDDSTNSSTAVPSRVKAQEPGASLPAAKASEKGSPTPVAANSGGPAMTGSLPGFMTGTGTVAAAKARRNRQRPTPTSPSLPAASVTFASSTSSAAMPAASPQVEPDSGADASDSDDATNTDIHTAASTPSAAFAASSASAADAGKASKRKPAAAEGSLASRELQAMPDLRENETASAASPTSRAEFTTVYDIIDKMENLLEEAKSSVFTPSVAKVDREEFLGALADLKKMLPVQLERASALMRESERRLDGAQTQANAIISEAQSRAADVVKEAGKQAEFLAGQENVVAIAQRKAQVILDKAQAQSDKLVQGANQYSSKVMEALASQLERYQQDVQAGVEVLREREREAASKLEGSYSDQNPDQHSDQ